MSQQLNKKLDDLAGDIVGGEQKLKTIGADIANLKQQISLLESNATSATGELEKLNAQNKELIQAQKELEQNIIAIIAEDLSFDLLLEQNETTKSEDSIIVSHILNKLNGVMKEDFKRLSKNYEDTITQINSQSNKINQINSSLKNYKRKQSDLLALENKQKSTINDLKRDKEISKNLLKIFEEREPDLIVLAGFLSILDGEILEKYKNKIINIHPSLLPKYGGKGMYGLKVHQAVFENGDKESGCTVHYVTSDVDAGEIIGQDKVDISMAKSPEEIQKIVLEKEWKLLPRVVKELIENNECDINEKRAEQLLRKYGFDFKNIDKNEIIELINKEINDFQEGSSEYIRLLCGYLYCLGDSSDVPLIEKAKYDINFDVGCMIDGEWIDSLENNGVEDEKKHIRTREEIIKAFVSYCKTYFNL